MTPEELREMGLPMTADYAEYVIRLLRRNSDWLPANREVPS